MNARISAVKVASRATTTAPVAGALLLLCYVLLSFLPNAEGYLGTDTGTKVYTLEVMSERDSFSPDIGYWAEALDPSGALHPVHHAQRRPDGAWVGVTTLPMLEAAQPLYRWGGYRAALLIPMVGGVASAFAARQVARRLDGSSTGWRAFWVIGLGSPVLVYSLDLWEHSLGVACVMAATAVSLGVLDGRPSWTMAATGALLGTGAVMRQEVLVYALVLVAGTCAKLLQERRALIAPSVAGASAVVGFSVPWLLNGVLESAVEGQSRAARSTGTATAAASGASSPSELGDRVEEGLQTLVGLVSGDALVSSLLGLVVVSTLLLAARAERRGDVRFARFGVLAVAAVYTADAVGGLGFVPGMLVAFPLAVGGLLAWNGAGRVPFVVGAAVASLPIIYAVQYLGAAAAQWGGRYTLSSGLLLAIAALVTLERRNPFMLRALVLLSFAVTALGAAWLVERSHGVDRFFEEVQDRSEPVIIARQAFLLREAGPRLVDQRWLSTAGEPQFSQAVAVVQRVGADRFTVLEWEAPAPPASALPAGVQEVERSMVRFVNTPVGVVTYEFTDSSNVRSP